MQCKNPKSATYRGRCTKFGCSWGWAREASSVPEAPRRWRSCSATDPASAGPSAAIRGRYELHDEQNNPNSVTECLKMLLGFANVWFIGYWMVEFARNLPLLYVWILNSHLVVLTESTIFIRLETGNKIVIFITSILAQNCTFVFITLNLCAYN